VYHCVTPSYRVIPASWRECAGLKAGKAQHAQRHHRRHDQREGCVDARTNRDVVHRMKQLGATGTMRSFSRNHCSVTRTAFGAVALLAALACRDTRSRSDESDTMAVSIATSSVARPERDPSLNIYAATGANMISAEAARAKPLVYVPNSRSASVSVIDPATYQVVRTFKTGAVPQHVVPSYDLARLWVLNNEASTVTPIDPATGMEGTQVHVDDPYNMYYTPDGKSAIVVAERRQRLDFRDPQTMKLQQSQRVRCKGLDHMEFTNDGRYVVATCEFSGHLVKVDLGTRKVVGYLTLDPGGLGAKSMPQDIRSSPDGRVFYVADMKADGVYLVDPVLLRRIGFIKTGRGTHGLYPSRDGRYLYITNRGWNTTAGGKHGPGSVSVLEFATDSIVATWPIPGGGSPDMGNVTADGKELWVSGRYDSEVYVIDTKTGALLHRIPVGREPHGLAVWPQPGRYSLGHTGNMR
jgi:YVTN family beta-propeller protein